MPYIKKMWGVLWFYSLGNRCLKWFVMPHISSSLKGLVLGCSFRFSNSLFPFTTSCFWYSFHFLLPFGKAGTPRLKHTNRKLSVTLNMKILMVCLGNICRSPMAEGLLRKKIQEQGLLVSVDSAGTSAHHIGQAPDARMIETAKRNGTVIED